MFVVLPGLKVLCLYYLGQTFINFWSLKKTATLFLLMLVIFPVGKMKNFFWNFFINFTITLYFHVGMDIHSQKLECRPILASKEHKKHRDYFPYIEIPNAFFFYSSCLTEEGQGSFAWIINKPEQHIQPTVCSLLQECVFLHTCYCYTPVITNAVQY